MAPRNEIGGAIHSSASQRPADTLPNDAAGLEHPLKVLDLFSGIGGFSLGLERATYPGGNPDGFETVAFCEIEEFPRKVLAKHWPDVPCYRDVRELTAERLAADGIAVDVITGGFPCQDVSCAGKQAGITGGTRSGLWSEIDRLIGELAPRYVIVENVANLLAGPSERPGGWFGRVLGDLACRGYNAEWANIPAGAIGAPQRRERVWIAAYPAKDNVEQVLEAAQSARELGRGAWRSWPDRLDKSFVCREADGLPGDTHRIAALGNAVVPQIPELIGRAILQAVNHAANETAHCDRLARIERELDAIRREAA